jgi:glycerol kinase
VIGIPVERPKMREATALGAAFAAGLSVGVWSGLSDIEQLDTEKTTFEPDMDESSRKRLLKTWNHAIKMCKGWTVDDEK